MMYGFTSNSRLRLFSKSTFIMSCLLNMLVLAFPWFLLPGIGPGITVATETIMVIMLAEALASASSQVRFRSRYVLTIVTGTVVMVAGNIVVAQDYMLYLPVLMAMLYLNTNTLLRSVLVNSCVVVLLAMPLLKALFLDTTTQEHVCVIVLFGCVSLLVARIFSMNKSGIEAAESTTSVMKGLHRLTTDTMSMDVNDELLSMRSAWSPNRYEFQEAFDRHAKRIDELVRCNLFDHHESTDVSDVVASLSSTTSNKAIIFCYICNDNSHAYVVKNMLVATLKHLFENAIAASADLANGPQHIIVVKAKNTLTITDTCGGFDIATTAKSNSSVFIRTILDASIQSLFGFEVVMKRTDNGTRVRLSFSNERI